VKSVAQGLEAVQTGPVDAKASKFPSVRSPNDYAVKANGGTTLCNHLVARVSRSGSASEFYEVLVAGLDAQNPGPDAAYENPSLSIITISEAYLMSANSCIFGLYLCYFLMFFVSFGVLQVIERKMAVFK
jgi:hypothetical protein